MHRTAYRIAIAAVALLAVAGIWAYQYNEQQRLEEEKRRAAEASARMTLAAGEAFRDGPTCPEMIVVPAGRFMMGSPDSESEALADERPQHPVTIAQAFAIGRYEVTFKEWDACVADGGCRGYRPDDKGWGLGLRPVIKVSWDHSQAYVTWLGKKTGKPYRLSSEAEWEYAARAGSTTRYWWGNDSGKNNANCGGCGSRWDGKQTAPVGSFRPNDFGLSDTAGNVWEWVEDCWNENYHGAPSDGSAWLGGNCSNRVLRGGSWSDIPRDLRSAYRLRIRTGYLYDYLGFRVARTLP